jgi:hypothetical protein
MIESEINKPHKNYLEGWENLLLQDIRLAGYGNFSEDIIPIEYFKNDLGYRSQAFENKADILFLGDSFTRGDGLPIEKVYTHILSEKLNLSFSCLATGGESVSMQIAKCFFYFKKYGHPKKIVALFPMHRFSYPYIFGEMENPKENIKQAKVFNSPGVEERYVLTSDLYEFKVEDYAKRPYLPRQVISNQLAFFYDRIMLDMLEQYCESNGIDFIWSCWNQGYQAALYEAIEEKYPGYHKNYCWIEANSWYSNGEVVLPFGQKEVDCHLEFSDDFLFHIAADRVKNNGRGAHNGSHWHMHASEDFYNFIVKKNKMI